MNKNKFPIIEKNNSIVALQFLKEHKVIVNNFVNVNENQINYKLFQNYYPFQNLWALMLEVLKINEIVKYSIDWLSLLLGDLELMYF